MRRFLLWLVLGSLALRLLSVGVSLLWYDELFTVAVSRLPLLSMLEAIKGDVHPPLWYFLEWAWIRLAGTGPLALRLPSVAFGTAAVAELYLMVKRIGGETPARWSGVLMAIIPAQLYYSQEARMYALLTLLVLMGARAIVNRNWLRLGLVAPLILYTQNTGFVYVLTLSIWALIAGRGAAFKKLLLGAALYSPWLVTAIHQATTLSRGFWLSFRPDVGALLYFIPFTTAFYRLPPQLYMHAAALAFILSGIGLYGLRSKLRKYAPLIAMTFSPPALLYAISFIWHPVLLDRALLPSGAALLGIWGGGLSQFTGWSRKALAVVALPFAVAGLITFYTDPTAQRARHDPIKPAILEEWQDGDALYFITLDSWAVYHYYLPDNPQFILPESGDLSQSLSQSTKVAMGIANQELPFSELRFHGYSRAWLFIVIGPVTSDYEIAQIDIIRATYPTLRTWHISKTEIATIELLLMGTTPDKDTSS